MILFFLPGRRTVLPSLLLGGRSIITWTRWGGRGLKDVCFCPRSGYKNCPLRGEGVKKWQNFVHVVVECPLRWQFLWSGVWEHVCRKLPYFLFSAPWGSFLCYLTAPPTPLTVNQNREFHFLNLQNIIIFLKVKMYKCDFEMFFAPLCVYPGPCCCFSFRVTNVPGQASASIIQLRNCTLAPLGSREWLCYSICIGEVVFDHSCWTCRFILGACLELVSKELNHLVAILHVYAGGLNFMK